MQADLHQWCIDIMLNSCPECAFKHLISQTRALFQVPTVTTTNQTIRRPSRSPSIAGPSSVEVHWIIAPTKKVRIETRPADGGAQSVPDQDVALEAYFRDGGFRSPAAVHFVGGVPTEFWGAMAEKEARAGM